MSFERTPSTPFHFSLIVSCRAPLRHSGLSLHLSISLSFSSDVPRISASGDALISAIDKRQNGHMYLKSVILLFLRFFLFFFFSLLVRSLASLRDDYVAICATNLGSWPGSYHRHTRHSDQFCEFIRPLLVGRPLFLLPSTFTCITCCLGPTN